LVFAWNDYGQPLSLSTGKVPETSKISKIKPILKKGSANEIENYRPISLLSQPFRNFRKNSI
jgi:hypothetical protein